ncbi:MAG: FG-GAP repeat protein [Xanthomonadales bacterium]|nr:FG-GAP repeat protein [Xanthomonadales bacterium]
MNRWFYTGLLLAGFLVPGGQVAAQLQAAGAQLWHQASPNLGLTPAVNRRFGHALSTGDYNCDGLDDAAISMPGSIFGGPDGGRVLVLYAADNGGGLSTTNRQIWSQSSPGVAGVETGSDDFGDALASGDFDNDGCDDLAIGVHFDNIEGFLNAGAVNVLYGSAAGGLTADDDDYWHQGPSSAGGALEAQDRFGSALAAGDFNGDGFDDLAIGIPGEDIGSGAAQVENAGAIQVLFGRGSGLSTARSVILRRGTNLSGSPVTDEFIGGVLAAGNANASFGDELIIGIPNFSISATLDNAGAIIIVSDVDGAVLDQTITQASTGIPGVAEADDRFGAALALGDFDGNGFAEVAVGVPGEGVGVIAGAGAINIIDITASNHTIWTQDDLPPEQAEVVDSFGSALATADFNGDGIDDLAIGASGENLGISVNNAGLVHVIQGSAAAGLTSVGRQIWSLPFDPANSGSLFGSALAAGRINSGAADLIIGAPNNSVSVNRGGSATVLYSPRDELFADGFEAP